MSEGKRRESSVASGPMMDKPDAQPVPDSADVRTPADVMFVELEWTPAEEFEDWFRQTFHNVPGLSIEMFNRFRGRADEFKAYLDRKVR